MHVWQWLVTGLVAGLIARLVLRGARLSLGADLALGSLGGLASGALLQYAGVVGPGAGNLNIIVALIGAVGLIATMQAIVRTTSGAGRLVKAAIKTPDLESAVRGLGDRERRVLRRFLQRDTIARDANVVEQERTTLGQRAADRIAAFGGSWAF
ncbi:MAG: hypothetical protein KDI32_02345, partial [Pseudomonadales bacterium]|nr:hypothetical protein [Pseudomonadales bacterium]